MATIYGTTSAEDLYGSSLNDYIYASDGNDTVYGNNGNDLISGENHNDLLSGDAGDDSVYGGAGNDTSYGGAGTNYLVGGIGNDSYILSAGSVNTVVENAAEGTDVVMSYLPSYFLPNNVENLNLGYGALYGYGNSLNNQINGNTSANFLASANGSDTVTGGDGNDTQYGGSATDSLSGNNGDDSLQGYGYTTGEQDSLTGGAGADKFVLGNSNTVFYVDNPATTSVNEGAGYAVITDFLLSQGDKFVVKGPITDYSLKKDINVIGGAALDTIIYYKGNIGDYVAVVQDNTNVVSPNDFIVV